MGDGSIRQNSIAGNSLMHLVISHLPMTSNAYKETLETAAIATTELNKAH